MEMSDFEDSPPCLIVGNSQFGEEIQRPRSTHLNILSDLAISKLPLAKEMAKIVECAVKTGDVQGDPQPQAGNEEANDGNSDHNNSGGDDGGGGGGVGGGGAGGGGNGGGDGSNGGSGGSGSDGGGGSGGDGGADGGGSGGGDGGGDGGNGSGGDDTTSHPTSSENHDSMPRLVPAHSTRIKANQRCIPASDPAQTSLSDSSSIHQSVTGSGSTISPPVLGDDTYSQASTGVVSGHGAGDIANVGDLHSEVSGRGSNSTVSIGSKSECKSTSNSSGSSVYPGDTSSLSSMSSVATLSSSPEVHQLHLSVNPLQYAQLTSDASSSSAGSKEAMSHSRTEGFAMMKSIEEDTPGESASKDDDAEVCSSQEDIFGQVSSAEPHRSGGRGHDHQAQEVSIRLHTPQHQSTPMGGSQRSQEPPREKSLYKQVLTKNASTPVEDKCSRITPIPVSDGFNSLQFDARETSSSSSEAIISPSPEAYKPPPIIPSSPTAAEDKEEESAAHKSAVEFPSHTDLAPETTDDDEVVLPRWQEKALKEKSAEDEAHEQNGNLQESSSAGLYSAPESSSKDDSESAQTHPWQSAVVTEESSSSNGIIRRDSCQTGKLVLTESRPRDVFLQDSDVLPTVCNIQTSGKDIITAVEQGPSMSPSSLVLDPELGVADVKVHFRDTGDGHATQGASVSLPSLVLDPEMGPADVKVQFRETRDDHATHGPSQPEMSQDLFQPSISQEERTQPVCTTERLEMSGPLDEESEFQSSFALHFTPSQSEDSQIHTDTSQNLEVTESRRDEGPTESARQYEDPEVPLQVKPNSELFAKLSACTDKEVGSLSKQESTESQSILAPIIFGGLTIRGDKGKERETNSSDEQLPQATASQSSLPAIECVVPECAPLDSTSKATVTSIGDQVNQEGTDEQFVSVTEAPVPEVATTEYNPPVFCTETSSESASGLAFHFSLPVGGEPLRPTTCTTPPPMKATRQAAPESGESGHNDDSVASVLPSVPEIPGISGEAPAPETQERPCVLPFLTLGMPRNESEVDDSEPTFLYERPLVTPQVLSASRIPRPSPKSIFSCARQEIEAKRKLDVRNEALSDNDPFSFSSEEDRGPPLKRPRRGKREGNKHEERRKEGGEKKARVFPSSNREQEKVIKEQVRQTSSKRQMASEVHSSSSKGEAIEKPNDKRQISSEDDTTEQAKKSSGEPSAEPNSASDSVSSERVRLRVVTKTRTITTVTTDVRRVITARSENKATGEIVNEITDEENEPPKVECDEQETIEEEEIVVYVRQESPQSARLLSAAKGASYKKEGRRKKSPRCKRTKCGESSGADNPPAERGGRVPGELSDVDMGTRVLARWLDNYFYPGQIVGGPSKNDQYNVSFDDGNQSKVPRNKLIVKDLLPVGQRVLVQRSDECYEEGRVVGYYQAREERGYKIERGDGKVEKSPVSQVILSAKQAADILSSSSSVPMAIISSGSGSELRSSRSRKSTSERGASPTLFSGDTSTKDTSEESSADAWHKKASSSGNLPLTAKKAKASDDSETPKSSLKRKFRSRGARGGKPVETSSERSSDEKGKRKRVRRGLSEMLGTKSPSTSDTVPTLRRSPRKHVAAQAKDSDATSEQECPMPRDRNLFAGLAFLITCVRHSKESEESDSESESVVFNRWNLASQIEAGGGTVMDSFTQTPEAEGLFLISNTFYRTEKYFQSLASGIPCVSHVWIHDCCVSDIKRDFRKYLLPGGRSLETGEIVECRPRRDILRNMTIFFHSSQRCTDFKDTWSSVARAAGCSVVAKLPNRPTRAAQARELDYRCDVVVCGDSKLPTRIRHAIDVLGIPAVSIEWLLQCLINGCVVRFDGHPKYHYTEA